METRSAKRVASIDILRGIVMVIMALDHARDYFSNYPHDPLDLDHTSTPMFFTRWITHFCAPVFVFLAGTSVFLSLGRGKSKNDAARTLLTRGIWLILLELTIVRFGWMFNFDYHLIILQVIWAIGCSMVALSLLIYLPRPLIAFIALAMIFGHNLLDVYDAPYANYAVWDLLHKQNPVPYGNGYLLFVIYPIVPWIGVMAMGYIFGALVRKDEAQRNRWFIGIGLSAIVLFFILRYTNAYGNPTPWQHRESAWRSFLSMLDCRKYPPSLLYLLMTLGPAILSLPLLEKLSNGIGKVFTVYGRVPMFYYILHIYLLHGMALVTGLIMGFPASRFTSNDTILTHDSWGFSLAVVYVFWLAAVVLLYFPCRWFMRVKMNDSRWWLSYL